jgi:hypothetical protein
MTEWLWWWGFGSQCERYEASFDTREEALADAMAQLPEYCTDEEVTIAEARRLPLRDDCFSADRVLEDWHNANEEAQDDDGELAMNWTPEQAVELEASLAATLAAWRTKHKLGRAWGLEIRSAEVVPLPQCETAAPAGDAPASPSGAP